MIDLATLAHEWIVTERTVPLTVTPAQVLDANPRRYAFALCLIATDLVPPPNENVVVVTLDPNNAVTGFILKTYDLRTFSFHDLSAFVQRPWYARRAGADAGAVLMVYEIIQTADLRD